MQRPAPLLPENEILVGVTCTGYYPSVYEENNARDWQNRTPAYEFPSNREITPAPSDSPTRTADAFFTIQSAPAWCSNSSRSVV